MPALTITRTAGDETSATLTLTNAKGKSCTGRFYGDGSGSPSEGTLWMYTDAQRALGKTRVRSAIQEAVRTGAATVEAI